MEIEIIKIMFGKILNLIVWVISFTLRNAIWIVGIIGVVYLLKWILKSKPTKLEEQENGRKKSNPPE